MCKPDRCILERIEGAELIAYLTEVDVELQKKASITDHCIPVIAGYFRITEPSSPYPTKVLQYITEGMMHIHFNSLIKEV